MSNEELMQWIDSNYGYSDRMLSGSEVVPIAALSELFKGMQLVPVALSAEQKPAEHHPRCKSVMYGSNRCDCNPQKPADDKEVFRDKVIAELKQTHVVKPADEQPVADSFWHKCISCGHRFEDPINIEIDIRTTVASCPKCRSSRIDIDVPEFKPFQQPQADMSEGELIKLVDELERLVFLPEDAHGEDCIAWMEDGNVDPEECDCGVHVQNTKVRELTARIRNSAKREG